MTGELALAQPAPMMDRDDLRLMMDQALRFVQSGLLPSEVNTAQKALLVMTAGREIGVPATYALRNIHVVKGKVTCSAELMLALVRRTYGPGAIRVGRTDNQSCTVQYREQGWDGISEYTFSMDDARQAGVTNNPTWKSYPAAMLRARTISAVVRFAFPECLAGLYTPEELGAEVEVNEQGEVIAVTEPARPSLSVVDNAPTAEEEERAKAMAATPVEATPAFPNDRLRDEARAEYARLVHVAVLNNHPRAADIEAKRAEDLDDARLVGSVRALQAWVASNVPAEPKEGAF
jgi:hypothetical protein